MIHFLFPWDLHGLLNRRSAAVMSKTARSTSRTHSHSPSRSRSRSESRSRSRSRSSSRSRSRKHRYGSRSRSRSKSHSPPHNWERKQPREYQNHREFRGYHRGFRRPYYFRGRGRGFFRGRFQRGGGGYNNNYRPNNWQNYRPQPQQKQQQQQQQLQCAQSPRRGHSNSDTPKKRSRSHSRRSDRSSSPHSHHSSSSGSSRQRSGSAQHGCKAAREVLSGCPEAQRSTKSEKEQGSRAEAEEGTKGGRTPDVSPLPVNLDSSPKRAGPQVCSAVTTDPAPAEAHPVSVSSGTISNVATCWQTVASTSSTTSLSKKSPSKVSGFGLFSDIDQEEDTNTIAMSMAFKKFLEEQKNKKHNSTRSAAESGNGSDEKKFEAASDRSSALCRPTDHGNKKESQKYKHVDRARDEEEEDEETKPHLPTQAGESAAFKSRSRLPLSAQELFEEQVCRFDFDDEFEAFLLSRKQERAASLLAALSKREKISRKLRELSPERPSKVRRKEKSTLSPSPTYAAVPRRSCERRGRDMVMSMSDESPPRPSGKRETEFSLRMDSLSDNLARSSVLSNDWRNAMEFVHPDKKEKEFPSVFQHLPCNTLCRSPSELFAQHLVAIVHHIKAQHFPSSGMTLNDRFAMYQRIAAEKEITQPRKSPEIHRRIDVSPSAFKRHSVMFDELKCSTDSSFKADGKQSKGDTVDLRLDIERRKKYIRDPNVKQEGDGESGGSPGSDMELSIKKSSKHLKKSKKSKKNRECSHSSSSASALSHEEEAESTEEGFSMAQLQLPECTRAMDRGQQQFRAQARGWNKVHPFGNNNSNNNSKTYVTVRPKTEDWDSEHTQKNRKYCLQVGKDGEREKKWAPAGGRGQPGVPRVKGRFILRRPTSAAATNSSGSHWSHDKSQASSEDELNS
ncbi:uncharacterized protein thrap3a isoform X2 [Brachyhypopomus gauderio]|uniref:uncharacterized protein thrap3a isoform X2 n=1 Tax=Brachyhypopomus gauderio TaxID=698409 RepID=UPI00404258C9